MTDIASASLLITPDLRRRLQQRYAEAQRLAANSKPDYRQIHNLLAECLRADPGSVLYLDALIGNLRRRDFASARSWLPKWLQPRRRSPEYSVLSTQYALLRAAPDFLQDNPSDARLLNQLAQAAAVCELDQVELRYYQLALETAPQDAGNVRAIAQACTWQGRLDEAAEYWKRLAQLLPEDRETLQALADLGEWAQFDAAEQALVNSQAFGAPLLKTLQQREELQLARSAHRLEIARRRAISDSHPKATSLVTQFEAEQVRLEIEIFHLRCERHPDDWRLRIELARRQKQVGNFSGAIQRLEEAAQLRPGEPAVLIELGECWQHLRQFTTALDYYRLAVTAAEESLINNNSEDPETLKLARYRAAVLASALSKQGEARVNLTALLAMDPSFKDAQQRLDNLGTN